MIRPGAPAEYGMVLTGAVDGAPLWAIMGAIREHIHPDALASPPIASFLLVRVLRQFGFSARPVMARVAVVRKSVSNSFLPDWDIKKLSRDPLDFDAPGAVVAAAGPVWIGGMKRLADISIGLHPQLAPLAQENDEFGRAAVLHMAQSEFSFVPGSIVATPRGPFAMSWELWPDMGFVQLGGDLEAALDEVALYLAHEAISVLRKAGTLRLLRALRNLYPHVGNLVGGQRSLDAYELRNVATTLETLGVRIWRDKPATDSIAPEFARRPSEGRQPPRAVPQSDDLTPHPLRSIRVGTNADALSQVDPIALPLVAATLAWQLHSGRTEFSPVNACVSIAACLELFGVEAQPVGAAAVVTRIGAASVPYGFVNPGYVESGQFEGHIVLRCPGLGIFLDPTAPDLPAMAGVPLVDAVLWRPVSADEWGDRWSVRAAHHEVHYRLAEPPFVSCWQERLAEPDRSRLVSAGRDIAAFTIELLRWSGSNGRVDGARFPGLADILAVVGDAPLIACSGRGLHFRLPRGDVLWDDVITQARR